MLHHVRTLVDTGFLIEQPTRRGAEGLARTALPGLGQVLLPPLGSTAGADGPDLLLETFLEEIKGLPAGQLDSARLGFRLTAEDRRRVQDRLQAVLDEIATMPSDPEGEPWSLYLGLHPDTSGVPSAHDVDGDH